MEKAINVYFIENNSSEKAKKGQGGQFYNVYRNMGDVLAVEDFISVSDDLVEIETSLKHVDDTFKRIGGVITARNEKISSLSIFEIKDGEVSLQSIEASRITVIQLERLKLINKRAALLQEIKITEEGLASLEKEEANVKTLNLKNE
jgi:hypothetical protein